LDRLESEELTNNSSSNAITTLKPPPSLIETDDKENLKNTDLIEAVTNSVEIEDFNDLVKSLEIEAQSTPSSPSPTPPFPTDDEIRSKEEVSLNPDLLEHLNLNEDSLECFYDATNDVVTSEPSIDTLHTPPASHSERAESLLVAVLNKRDTLSSTSLSFQSTEEDLETTLESTAKPELNDSVSEIPAKPELVLNEGIVEPTIECASSIQMAEKEIISLDEIAASLNEAISSQLLNEKLQESPHDQNTDKEVPVEDNTEQSNIIIPSPEQSSSSSPAAAAAEFETAENTMPNIEIISYQHEWDQLNESETTLGLVAPTWLADQMTDECLKCKAKFSFRKRRHHCRACGLIFCSDCAHLKLSLVYRIRSDAQQHLSRVCTLCYDTISRVNDLRLNLERAALSAHTNSTIVSVLKRKKSNTEDEAPHHHNTDNNNGKRTESISDLGVSSGKLTRTKSVRFSDGFAPGKAKPENSQSANGQNLEDTPESPNDEKTASQDKESSSSSSKSGSTRTAKKYKNHTSTSEEFDEKAFIQANLESSSSSSSSCKTVTLVLLKNLKVDITVVNVGDHGKCWLLVTQGLCLNGLDEIVFILKWPVNGDKIQIPRQIIYHVMDIFERSLKAASFRLGPMNHLLYDFDSAKMPTHTLKTNSENLDSDKMDHLLLDNKENTGFFYFRPSDFHSGHGGVLDALQSFLPQNEPFLIGYLIHRWEVPWAKLFPLRLYLRLGEQLDCKHILAILLMFCSLN
jgi:hypothetical protein